MLLISIDTLRADRLGCQGYLRDTTPALDDFASKRAVRFANATAESSWTLPSHVTLLSGLHPLTHGVRTPDRAPGRDVELLAETLTKAGWYAFGITDGGWLSAPWGFDRGFASFEARDRDIVEAVDETLAFIRHREPRGPWFGFLHSYDVHCPYDPPEPWRGRYQSPGAEPIAVQGRCGNPDFNAQGMTPGQARYLSDRYDEDVRRVDDALGRLFAEFEALGLFDHTLVIVTSDHGEEFLEHGQIGHERTLQGEVLAVPLLMAVPGRAPEVVERTVGLADVVPTILERVGLSHEGSFDGRSLFARSSSDGVASDLAWQVDLASWRSSEEHLILDRAAGVERYFDLRMDPEETQDRAGGAAERVKALRKGLEAHARGLTTRRSPLVVKDPGSDQLEALGYAERR